MKKFDGAKSIISAKIKAIISEGRKAANKTITLEKIKTIYNKKFKKNISISTIYR